MRMPRCEYLQKTAEEASNNGIAKFECSKFGYKWLMYILSEPNNPSGTSGININKFKECSGCEYNQFNM